MGTALWLLCVCVARVWSTEGTTPTASSPANLTTAAPTAAQPRLPDVDNVTVIEHNETALTLQWNPVSNDSVYSYKLQYSNGTHIDDITGDVPVTYTVLNLTAATKYKFTLFTVSKGEKSFGKSFSATTRPLNVDDVKVERRRETRFILQWNEVSRDMAYTLQYSNGTHIADIPSVFGERERERVTYPVDGLALGTEYDFTLFTVFDKVRSTGKRFSAVTTIRCSEWTINQTSFIAEIFGKFSFANATNGRKRVNGTVENKTVSFTGQIPGDTFSVELYVISNSVPFRQCNHRVTLVPSQVTDLRCDYESGGYALKLSWAAPEIMRGFVLVEIPGRSRHRVLWTQLGTVIEDVQPARTYRMNLTSLSEDMKSEPVVFECSTDPRGVIAGSVIVVLLLAALVLVIFTRRHRPELLPDWLRPEYVPKSLPCKTYKAVPVGKFKAHFTEMSRDQGRGFSEEYWDLVALDPGQTRYVALASQNKDKNRFMDTLPYDWCRVKLSKIDDQLGSDYINASHITGYGDDSGQYIAAQGPLPCTVNDFWRMIWEQRAHCVVMVTNCVEGGNKVKCEQYWPLDDTPCTYGNLSVSVSHEKKEENWTLREFAVTDTSTSEVRPVKHFHFTAWPDHGVPVGTAPLIQFRGLVRDHMNRCCGPAVVHCSAGVGRTGTLIALDVILQQLETERKVCPATCVLELRQRRPLMVQVESQYIFLHQCIVDYLRLAKIPEEPFNQKADVIFVNSTTV